MTQQQTQMTKDNPMRQIRIEKVLLSCGATGKDLEKAKMLLSLLSNMKPQVIASTKRIPTFNVRPGLEVGTRATLRGKKSIELLKRLLAAKSNTLSESQVSKNHFSFGIKEYVDIPDVEYQRDIGIRGFNVTVVFLRPGFRVKRKKIKSGKVPSKQYISEEEIIKYMEEEFDTEFL